MPEGSAALDPVPTLPVVADSLPLARRIAALIRERRGSDLVLLDVRRLVDYTDFFLLASGQSSRQNQAIGEHVVKSLKQERHYAISKSGLDTGSWICLDMGDVVVHVFDPETRARYDLELLWADAPRVDTEERAEPPAPEPPAKRRRVTRKAAVVGADADNAPDSERPPEDLPEDDVPAARPPKAKRPVPREVASKGPAAKRAPAMPKARSGSKKPAGKAKPPKRRPPAR